MTSSTGPIVTLTTDFGTADHYVAAMKGIILTHAPHARLVDITHAVAPQNVVHAAFALWQSFACFPVGTIHLVVVDPGVGTDRRLIAARYDGRLIIAPDNGVTTFIHLRSDLEALREITNPKWRNESISNTFHGRDILAPAAGMLASGAAFSEVGPQTDHLEVLNLSDASVLADGTLQGYVLHVDHYGNIITNITASDVLNATESQDGELRQTTPPPQVAVTIAERVVDRFARTYGDVPEGSLLCLIGSAGLLEIAMRGGHAAAALRATPGMPVSARCSVKQSAS